MKRAAGILPTLLACTLAGFLGHPAPGVAQPSWVRERLDTNKLGQIPPKAAAMVLFREADITINARGSATAEHHQIVKLLRKPFGEFGGMAAATNEYSRVTDLEGWLIKPSGTMRTLDDEEVTDVALQNDATVYNDELYRVASFSDAEAGDLVAFAYTVHEDEWTGVYQSFVFQNDEPVTEARFSVRVPDGWAVNVGGGNLDSLGEAVREGNRYTWTARNLPHRPDEPLMPSRRSLARWIFVAAYDPTDRRAVQFPDWQSVARWSDATQEAGMLAGESVARKVEELTAGIGSIDGKVEAIAKFVRDDIRYVAVEIGKGRWQPRPAALTLQNRYGDCKDKTALMRAMLEVLDLSTAAVLASADSRVITAVPSPFQFNHCIVAFAGDDSALMAKYAPASIGRWIIYDPTDETARLGVLPKLPMESSVLIADSGESGLREVPVPTPQADTRRTVIMATLHSDGSVDADVRLTYAGKWAEAAMVQFRKRSAEDESSFWREQLGEAMQAPVITGIRRWAGGDTAVWAFHCASPRVLVAAGATRLLKANPIATVSPPQLTKQDRIHPVSFGPPRLEAVEVIWNLPTGWKVTDTGAEVSGSCEIARVQASADMRDGVIRFAAVQEFRGGTVPALRYAEAKAFERQLNAAETFTLELQPH